jgi:type II secretory pathway component PulL
MTISIYHIWTATALLFILILAPLLVFLFSGWNVRRRDITDGFTAEAIRSYFQTFHPNAMPTANLEAAFDKYYRSQFGRLRFLLPLLLFASITGLALCLSTLPEVRSRVLPLLFQISN